MNKRKIEGAFLVVLTVVLSGALIAQASLTFTGTAITGDAASTIDVGTGTLSIQTTNNGAITAGTGAFTIPALLFTNATGTNFRATTGNFTTASSTGITFTNATGSGLFAAGSSTVNGSLTINGGTAILKHLSGTRTFTVGAVASSSCTTATSTTVTGTSAGDTVVASPTPVTNGIETQSNMTWLAYASTTDVVAFKACNTGFTNSGAIADQAWRFDVWKH
ncbi:MAG: hypothetical protein A2946_02480 [Candidatus Liptonbacteria bacterium RIFCSPLOWO2_01_FULL_53_13]|uniref:Uncharacterized protein n=1 Tax=Candidatus Liptonbacteria bacterium RIFCSPLOWO2_01_FULL_53_13 TaxID=1798651 RepID=A0A1G2CPG3_9BACT|nr:MAG: hypothetical protein A2946_02480 [Candidatus Liptonbacteria bacterium RIFCSPLOWO2_01_FULL_53_13]